MQPPIVSGPRRSATESGVCALNIQTDAHRDSGDSRIEDCETMRMVSLDIFRIVHAPMRKGDEAWPATEDQARPETEGRARHV